MAGTNDQMLIRRLEAVLTSTESIDAIVEQPGLLAAFGEFRGQVEGDLNSLRSAVRDWTNEGAEERHALRLADEAADRAIDEYDGQLVLLRALWIPAKPAAREALGAAEVDRRRHWLDTTFRSAPSDLRGLGRVSLLAYVTTVAEALQDSADAQAIVDAGIDAASFNEAVEGLRAAVGELDRERRDDGAVFDQLNDARRSAANTYSAGRSLLDAALRLSGSTESVNSFMLREVRRRTPDVADDTQRAIEAAISLSDTPAGPTNES